jgi:hypothetical protein
MPRKIARPSPAMAVAVVALFLSLSGVSYGVATGFIDSREIKDNQVQSRDIRQNSIRTKDLRNNEIRGRDIRKSTVRSEDVALNTLTGNDINESRLAKVPAAGTADTATSATSATRATSAGTVATLDTIAPRTLIAGQVAVLATRGPITVAAACQATATGTLADVLVTTTEAASSIASTITSDPQFGPASVDAVSVTDPASGPPTSVTLAQDGSIAIFTPSGAALTGIVIPWADASAGASGTCKFHGYAVPNG